MKLLSTRAAVRFGSRRARLEALEPRLFLAGTPVGVTPTALSDLVIQNGDHVDVYGTDAADRFVFRPGSVEHEIAIDGETYRFDAESVTSFTFYAGPEDTAVFYDSPAEDMFLASPEEARLESDAYVAKAIGAGKVHAYAQPGGFNVAHLYDSEGDDELTSRPAVAQLRGDGFLLEAHTFEAAHGYAKRGGYDVATLYDSAGDDSFVGRSTWSRMSGTDYFNRAKFFDEVRGVASEGNDHARIYDSRGDDFLTATPTEAILGGDGFSNTVAGFDSVTAYATSRGFDVAELIDSAGDDTFYAKPGQTALFGTGYINRANYFDIVHAYARNGGYDMANLHDSPGDDSYVGKPKYGKLRGDGFMNRAKLFESVHAYADAGGDDTAWLFGSAGDDLFTARENYSRLEGPGYEHRVGSFDAVYATAGAGADDRAEFIDSAGLESLEADGNRVRLTDVSTGSLAAAKAFDSVLVKLRNDSDRVAVADSATVRLTIKRPAGAQVIQADDFLDPTSPTWGIQDAVDALPEEGGVVVISEGTYVLRASIVLRSGVTLRGAGTRTILARADQVEAILTRAATTGDTVLEVASTDGFRVGDAVSVFAYGQPRFGHPVIQGIEDGKLILAKPIEVDSYFDPAKSAAVVNYFPLVRTNWIEEDSVVTDVIIENLTFDGNFDVSTEQWRIVAPAPIQLENAVDAVIRDSVVRRAPGSGIRIEYGRDNKVENTLVEDVRGHGIFVSKEADTIISGVIARRAGQNTRSKVADGILVEGSSDIRVENSLTEYNRRYGLHPGGDLNRGGVWINNISRYNERNGFHFCWDNFDIVAQGNEIYGNARNGVGGLGLGGPFGDMFNTVVDNRIYENGRNGIAVNGGSDNFILGNTIFDNSQKKNARDSGVLLYNSMFFTVANNRIGSNSETPTQKYGIEEVGIANDNIILRNDTSGNVEGGIYVVGGTTLVSGNTGTVR